MQNNRPRRVLSHRENPDRACNDGGQNNIGAALTPRSTTLHSASANARGSVSTRRRTPHAVVSARHVSGSCWFGWRSLRAPLASKHRGGDLIPRAPVPRQPVAVSGPRRLPRSLPDMPPSRRPAVSRAPSFASPGGRHVATAMERRGRWLGVAQWETQPRGPSANGRGRAGNALAEASTHRLEPRRARSIASRLESRSSTDRDLEGGGPTPPKESLYNWGRRSGHAPLLDAFRETQNFQVLSSPCKKKPLARWSGKSGSANLNSPAVVPFRGRAS